MTDLNKLTVVEAAAGIARGEYTSEALVSACLARIASREPEVKAWASLDKDYALRLASAADAAARTGRGTGVLHGVPIGIKDIIDTSDLPTENGSAVFAGRRPERDATCVAALRAAGAIILGKTVTTELATLTPSVTRNPLNGSHTPGGSSSGSAAAVADFMVPAALGTQTGGSVIRPASFCGVYGYKPTFGAIPRGGVLAQAPSLDTIGIHARSIEDLALLSDVLFGREDADKATRETARPGLLATATMAWKVAPMFAFVKSAAWAEASAVLREAYDELVGELGANVQEEGLDLTIERGLSNARIVQNVELAANYGPLLDRNPELISPRLAGQIAEGREIKGADYFRALSERDVIYSAIADILINYGTILTPAAPGPAPQGLGSTGNPVFNAFWTYIGVPCVTLPLLEAEGLPIGVQLVGARGDDGRLLRSARLLERQLAQAA